MVFLWFSHFPMELPMIFHVPSRKHRVATGAASGGPELRQRRGGAQQVALRDATADLAEKSRGHWKTMGKPMGKPWENGKTLGKPWENGD